MKPKISNKKLKDYLQDNVSEMSSKSAQKRKSCIMAQSSKKHPKLANLGNKAGSNDFSKRQPTSEQKKEGWKRKRFGREIIRELLENKFNLSPKLKKSLEKEFGNVDDKTAGELMSLRQIQKAIKYSDTFALINLLNQAYGQPKQEIENTVNMIAPVINVKPSGRD